MDTNSNYQQEYSEHVYTLKNRTAPQKEQHWKINDRKAQKNGPHSAIYWVKKKQRNEDGSMKVEKWIANTKYIGDWKDNKKDGFGIQFYGNGDKYEGGWQNNVRNGQGTFWVCEGKNKLRREYTGDWVDDKKTGKGTMFYNNGDRYDGLWLDDKPHDEGRMIYANGDVYEGQWFVGKRSGYGVMTKRNGDHFEGHWVNDKREGQGSYFFALKNQVFVGEWVDDMPKTGVYSEVEDPYTVKQEREKHFTDPYILPNIPKIQLKNPTKVLQEAMENVRKQRTIYRARYIPIDELYTEEERLELYKEFAAACDDNRKVSVLGLNAILANMDFELTDEDIKDYLEKLKPENPQADIDYDTFARLIAIILEDKSFDQGQEENDQVYEDENEEDLQQYQNDVGQQYENEDIDENSDLF
ncbi:hypothetical protein ABPG72_004359 [Tetrahymena utriculariae]